VPRAVYVIEGRSRWRVSDQEREAAAGDVLIVRAGEPHKFSNSGDGPSKPEARNHLARRIVRSLSGMPL
jgi:quercetin dioxygenase-like cupin family protein